MLLIKASAGRFNQENIRYPFIFDAQLAALCQRKLTISNLIIQVKTRFFEKMLCGSQGETKGSPPLHKGWNLYSLMAPTHTSPLYSSLPIN